MVNRIINIYNLKGEWDDDSGEYYFPLLEVISEIAEADNPQGYLDNLKKETPEYGFSICSKIIEKTTASGENELVEVVNTQNLFRFVQLVPSAKAEPIRQWLAENGSERISEIAEPDMILQKVIFDLKKDGYSDEWIAKKTAEIISS